VTKEGFIPTAPTPFFMNVSKFGVLYLS